MIALKFLRMLDHLYQFREAIDSSQIKLSELACESPGDEIEKTMFKLNQITPGNETIQ